MCIIKVYKSKKETKHHILSKQFYDVIPRCGADKRVPIFATLGANRPGVVPIRALNFLGPRAARQREGFLGRGGCGCRWGERCLGAEKVKSSFG